MRDEDYSEITRLLWSMKGRLDKVEDITRAKSKDLKENFAPKLEAWARKIFPSEETVKAYVPMPDLQNLEQSFQQSAVGRFFAKLSSRKFEKKQETAEGTVVVGAGAGEEGKGSEGGLRVEEEERKKEDVNGGEDSVKNKQAEMERSWQEMLQDMKLSDSATTREIYQSIVEYEEKKRKKSSQ
eukprot:GILI01021566.1.p1 GENE.GILI01021566.1~~GILI01021566.1.p1  ORF type:complete len:199 (-),score=43.76 GILI01021566.1:230-778(-)